jgi:hypothetical protein
MTAINLSSHVSINYKNYYLRQGNAFQDPNAECPAVM